MILGQPRVKTQHLSVHKCLLKVTLPMRLTATLKQKQKMCIVRAILHTLLKRPSFVMCA